ncbi:glucose-1-phosphate adenylyltransferase [Paenibacillus crassostreae]|uniref:Glucose-1-phosphate adenylyltransferase n=1 Tax=Paenibacillus crassostreae TaxID=1763538 RepID=A0A167DTM4_9BACL|nr:glucose-1-phosphate adenylyltransferase [Paenibacillus crassostreae]AOZ91079.1 glucose-1-phosphate adenylyltransferase [Paenibacillus crassostreae]OAB74760.1 glucose-1-phosphate adenylyltransferase [Paenibacillus crassostreae]
MIRKECIAMLLAGGEGRRLAPFTSEMAKPAVPFGGHYRIIDFPLSNCVNSGIETVGVLTQYEANSLHDHIELGEPWGLHNTRDGGLTLLPSYKTGNDYSGTADAIYKNMEYIDQHDPEHVVILSGDHIYHMDYSHMLEDHKNKNAQATISVIEVPLKEASRFGVLSVDKEMQIYDFHEKPEHPESNLASMGVYIFKWSYLRELLIHDAANLTSTHDFGKDIIPTMVSKRDSLFAYQFNGYWRDVGTVESLWEAHMDLLDHNVDWEIHKTNWPMYSRPQKLNMIQPKHKSENSTNCMLSDSCYIEGYAENSVIFYGVEIGKNSMIKDSVIMPHAKIGRHVIIEHAIIGEGAVIKDGSVIQGSVNQVNIVGPREVISRKPTILTQPARILQDVYENSTRLRAELL